MRGVFASGQHDLHFVASNSDVEHLSKGPYVGGKGKGSDPMTLGSRPDFWFHSKRTEQDRLCAGLLDRVQKGVSAVRMIAIYDYGAGFFPEDDILDGLCPPEKPWLQASELYQHTQQRRDDFLARENKHGTQHKPAERRLG